MKFKEIIVLLLIFVVGSLIVSVIINASNLDSIKNKLTGFSIVETSTLDVILNPEKYVDQEITLRNVVSCFDEKITALREDGTVVSMDSYYPRDINHHYKFDFTGKILEVWSTQGKGYRYVDEEPTYSFNITRAVQKELAELDEKFSSCY